MAALCGGPSEALADAQGEVKIVGWIHTDGSATGLAVEHLRATAAMDGQARAAITGSAPYDPFPYGIAVDEVKVRFTFGSNARAPVGVHRSPIEGSAEVTGRLVFDRNRRREKVMKLWRWLWLLVTLGVLAEGFRVALFVVPADAAQGDVRGSSTTTYLRGRGWGCSSRSTWGARWCIWR